VCIQVRYEQAVKGGVARPGLEQGCMFRVRVTEPGSQPSGGEWRGPACWSFPPDATWNTCRCTASANSAFSSCPTSM